MVTLGVTTTVSWVGLFTVIWFTCTSLVPNPTVVAPAAKFVLMPWMFTVTLPPAGITLGLTTRLGLALKAKFTSSG